MHVCPNCGAKLTARPSHCYEPASPLSTNIRKGTSGVLILTFAGIAIATLLILSRLLIG